MFSADIIMSAVMYVISGIMFWQMQKIGSMDSRIFPTAVAILLIVLATILLLVTVLGKHRPSYDFKNTARGLKLFGILLVFAVCTRFFGFFTCVPFFLFTSMYYLGQRNRIVLAAVTIGMTVIVILMFDVLFDVMLPEGTLFDLYAHIMKR